MATLLGGRPYLQVVQVQGRDLRVQEVFVGVELRDYIVHGGRRFVLIHRGCLGRSVPSYGGAGAGSEDSTHFFPSNRLETGAESGALTPPRVWLPLQVPASWEGRLPLRSPSPGLKTAVGSDFDKNEYLWKGGSCNPKLKRVKLLPGYVDKTLQIRASSLLLKQCQITKTKLPRIVLW